MARSIRQSAAAEDTRNPTFSKLYDAPTSELQEKKGDYTYLSWPYAVKALREFYPNAIYGVYTNPTDGLPFFYLGEKIGFMVHVYVELHEVDDDGRESQALFEEWFPVLDNKNKPVLAAGLNAFDINTSIKRAIVKCISQATGFGLKLYAGEDLPGAPAALVEEMYELANHELISDSVRAKVDKFFAPWKAKDFYPKEAVLDTISQLQTRIDAARKHQEDGGGDGD